jgi:hypothetical protein
MKYKLRKYDSALALFAIHGSAKQFMILSDNGGPLRPT